MLRKVKTSRSHGLLDDLLVDVVAQLHAVLQVLVVICVRASRLNVLVNRVYLRLV